MKPEPFKKYQFLAQEFFKKWRSMAPNKMKIQGYFTLVINSDYEFGWIWLNLVDLGWLVLTWVDLGWLGLTWVELGWIGLNWVELGWIGLHWVELGWIGINWVELCLEKKNFFWNLLGGVDFFWGGGNFCKLIFFFLGEIKSKKK